MKRIATAIAALGLAGWIGSFAYFAYLQGASPGAPVPATEQVVEEKNHGRRFYVTSAQDTALQYGRIGSWIVLMAGIGIGLRVRSSHEKPGQPPAPTPTSQGGSA